MPGTNKPIPKSLLQTRDSIHINKSLNRLETPIVYHRNQHITISGLLNN